MGVKLALDDFGTGYSSLSYLLEFPVDIVKIDQIFVARLGHDHANQAIVAAIIQLAHDLRLTVTAEGVETAEQHRELIQLGCDSCQGYYFARPMAAAGIHTLLDPRGHGADLRLPSLIS
jgi:EAL domain-containing protein (putative c-di-GMP-specific phosphodiesterase class I)